MRPMGALKIFGTPWLSPRLLFSNFSWAIVLTDPIDEVWMCVQNLKSIALLVPEIIGTCDRKTALCTKVHCAVKTKNVLSYITQKVVYNYSSFKRLILLNYIFWYPLCSVTFLFLSDVAYVSVWLMVVVVVVAGQLAERLPSDSVLRSMRHLSDVARTRRSRLARLTKCPRFPSYGVLVLCRRGWGGTAGAWPSTIWLSGSINLTLEKLAVFGISFSKTGFNCIV